MVHSMEGYVTGLNRSLATEKKKHLASTSVKVAPWGAGFRRGRLRERCGAMLSNRMSPASLPMCYYVRLHPGLPGNDACSPEATSHNPSVSLTYWRAPEPAIGVAGDQSRQKMGMAGSSSSAVSRRVTSLNPRSSSFLSGINTRTLPSFLPSKTRTGAALGCQVHKPRTSGRKTQTPRADQASHWSPEHSTKSVCAL